MEYREHKGALKSLKNNKTTTTLELLQVSG
jgi:hypothetical protein